MNVTDAFRRRFADAPDGEHGLASMAARGSCRAFTDAPVPDALLRELMAIALSAPTKSDLQQRDILQVTDPDLRAEVNDCCGTQAWVAQAPILLIFLANHRRQRRLSEMHALSFPNDHADAPFNAAMDAAIAMATFVASAEAVGLGCCPISAIRNEPERVSAALGLPDLVFPAVALGVGWPLTAPKISMRLPLATTIHQNRYDDGMEDAAIRTYDADRQAAQPYRKQRFVEDFGESPAYGWSEDKARQYAKPERGGFGKYLRSIGFSLE